MAQSRSPKRQVNTAGGIKKLITAAALAATLGGWAAFATADARTAVPAAPASPITSAQAAPTMPTATVQPDASATGAQGLQAPVYNWPAPAARTRSSR